MKWNSNNGYVGGHDKATTQRQPVDLNIHEETAIEAPTSNLDVIAEGDSDEESDDEELAFVAVGSSLGKFVNDSDVPQAFSHFTYCHTKRKQVVCDLQGVLNKSVPDSPFFELTDPVIHHRSKKKRARECVRPD
jgi:hypothetical protein